MQERLKGPEEREPGADGTMHRGRTAAGVMVVTAGAVVLRPDRAAAGPAGGSSNGGDGGGNGRGDKPENTFVSVLP